MEIDEVIRTFLNNYKNNDSCITGFLNDNEIDSFLDCLKALGFSFYKRNSIVYETSRRYKSSKIRYSYGTKIPFFGSPFLITKTVYMRCSQDGDYKSSEKNTKNALNTEKKITLQPTKKLGCKAFLHITYLLVFQHISVQDRQSDKREASEKIKSQLTDHVKVGEQRLLIEMSDIKEHCHPRTNENQIIHPSLKSEIYRLVSRNVSLIGTIKQRLSGIVEQMVRENKIPQPSTNNHCFYPPNEVIRYHVNMAKFSLKKEFVDSETTAGLIKEWVSTSNDYFYFEPNAFTNNNPKQRSSPVFCYQTRWQHYLLNLYGNSITILDPAYKTIGYCFPVYFLVVKTNQSFIVVGMFVLSVVSENSIKEALTTFKNWSPDWNPKYMLCNLTENELSAVKLIFPVSIFNICSYRIEHTWKKFLSEETAADKADEVLKLWRALLYSKTEDEFKRNELAMRNNQSFKGNSRIETYFYKTWYSARDKWVLAYQTHEFYVYMNINDGLSNGNVFFSYEMLCQHDSRTLSSVLTTIIQEYLPITLHEYVGLNSLCEFETIPEFLINCSAGFVKHVMERLKVGEFEYRGATIICTENKKFMLQNNTEEVWYHVDLEDVNCTCDDFQRWRFPCKHMCAIFTYTTWNMSTMASWYLQNPFIKFDDGILELYAEIPSLVIKLGAEKELTCVKEDDLKMDVSDMFVQNMGEQNKVVPKDALMCVKANYSIQEEWTENYENIAAVCTGDAKKSSIEELLKSISNRVPYLNEDELDKCYATLKKLQEEIVPSSMTNL